MNQGSIAHPSKLTVSSTIPYFGLAILCVIGVTWLRIHYLLSGGHDLYFDEAQYWDWSKTLDWGYYSKPPVVAWVIAATGAFCGDAVWCIKLGSPLAHAVTGLSVFAIGRHLFDERIGFWSTITFLTLPATTLSSTIMSTDPFLLASWAVSMFAALKALENDAWRWWIIAAVFAGLGMLSKYSFLFFLPSALWAAHILGRKQMWKQPKCIVAVVITFLIYCPNLWWNYANDFVSYSHTQDNANLGGGSLFRPAEMLEFFGAQFVVFGPVLFATLVWMLARWRRLGRSQHVLSAFVLPFLGIILLLSLLSRAHANWAAPVYVAATVMVVAYLLTHHKRWVLLLSLGLHVAVAGVFYHFDDVMELAEITPRKDPFYRVRGWERFGADVSERLKSLPDYTVLVDTRKAMTELLYYGKPKPFPIVKWNGDGDMDDHYDLTTTMEGREGDNFLLITDSDDLADIFNSFERVSAESDIDIPTRWGRVRHYDVYRLENFLGYGEVENE